MYPNCMKFGQGFSCEEILSKFGLIWSQFGSQRNCENFFSSISERPVRDLPPLVLELALACIPFFSGMQELWRLKNDLPAYRSTAAAWLSNVEIDRNDMADYTEKVLLFWRSNAPKFPAWGRLTRVFLSMALKWHPPLPPSSASFRSATTCLATPS